LRFRREGRVARRVAGRARDLLLDAADDLRLERRGQEDRAGAAEPRADLRRRRQRRREDQRERSRRDAAAHGARLLPNRRTTPPPPWTLIVCPLTQPLAGEQSQSIAFATSSGRPGRPVRLSGCISRSCIAGSMPASP
jgi:hypothetical protein